MPIASTASNLVTEADATNLKVGQGPCRFCGTGCGVMVATRENRVSRHARRRQGGRQPRHQLRQGYFLSKIMYGTDRLTSPAAHEDGKFDKQGRVPAGHRDQAFDIMEEKYKAALKARGSGRSPGRLGRLRRK